MMKTYERYKPSGVEWIGDIPEHWGVSRLKFLLAQNDGGVWGNDADGVNDDATKVFRSTEINFDGSWNFDEEPELRLLSKQDKNKALLIEGDLLVTKSSGSQLHIGKTALVTYEIEKQECCYSNFTQRLRPLYKESSKYLHIFLNSNLAREQYNYLSNSTTGLANLSAGLISDVFIPTPELQEQAAIANYLDEKTAQLDKLIEGKRRLIALLKEERSGVINQAVTRGINPHAKLKRSGIDWIGDIPEEWIVNKFNRVAFLQEGPGLRNWQFRNNGIKVICVTNITEQGINFGLLERYISEEEYNSTYQHFTVSKGDYLLASSGASWGKVAEYKSDERVILNTSTIRLNTKDDRILKREYVNLILRSPYVKEHLNLLLTGSCQPNFGPSHLNQLFVIYPTSTDEQQQIIQFIEAETSKIDATVAKIEKEIEYLQEYRTALISEVVTGKIKVV